MASTAELEAQILAEMETNPDAFADGPVDDVLNIDAESKTIDLPLSESLFGVEGEKDVERKYFRCPKIVGDNIDLSTHQIYVHYATATTKTGEFDTDKMTGAYHCDDVEIDESGNYITFSWLLSDNALLQPGFVGFAVFAKYSEGEELKTKWKTQPATGTVAMTVPDGEVIVEKYPDVINQIFTKLAEMEKGNVSDEVIAEAVSEYMEANKVEIPETLPNPKALTIKQGTTELIYDGSGAVTITIPTGDGRSATERLEKASTDTDVTLDPNKLYIFPEMAELNITLADISDTAVVNEFHFIFQSGETATTLSIPDTVKIPDNLTVEAGKIYEISIMENCLTYQSWAVS